MARIGDPAASLLARLRNKAAYAGEPFQAVLQIFCQEELLRRLERSRFAGNLILKGGMFLYVATSFKSRPTVDIDFLLRSHSNEQSEVERMVAEILRIETENDFVSFDLEGVKSIPANQIYVGSQVHLIARIKNTRTPLKIDIGVGDAIVPGIEKRVVPTQLENFLSLTVLTYSFESTIAEKLHAMMQYKHMGSRMKDYYDVNYLSRTYDFRGKVLGRAVSETFRIRGAKVAMSDFEDVVALGANADMLSRWDLAMVRKNLSKAPFPDILNEIDVFLSPVVHAVAQAESCSNCWDHSEFKWR